MSIKPEQIVAEALELPSSLRAFVAEKLIESLEAPEVPRLSAKWKAELRRRCAEVDREAVSLRAAEVVFKRANAALA
ncbi:MAG: addiction module protein [Lentisphaerae bacterium]|nr:addiction module protein [Lentisphaerota bacterium]